MLPYLWMLWGALAFAVMTALAHALDPYCDWQVVALARSGLALAFSTGLAVAGGAELVYFRPRTLWMRSIAGSLSLVCNFYALSQLPPSEVLTLTSMFPVWVAILSWPMLGHAPQREVWLGVICGLAGVVLIQQPHLAQGNLATLAAVSASFTSAVALIGLHRLQGIDPRAVVVHFSAVSLVFVVASFFAFETTRTVAEPLVYQPHVIAMLLGVGICATVGQLLLTKAFAAGSPAKVSVVCLSQVGFGLLIDVYAFGYTFNAVTLLGMLLVMMPTAWLLLRRST